MMINSNMRCIEIRIYRNINIYCTPINSNMRCIEMLEADRNKFYLSDKQ